MNKNIIPLIALGSVLLAGCATTSVPEVTPEGLVLLPKTRADHVWMLPEADLSVYDQVTLLDPKIAFRKNWQSDVNVDRPLDRISDEDMVKMIASGEKMLVEEFTQELEKGGYSVVTAPGTTVLAIKTSIINLDIFAPDPDDMAGIWSKTYSNGSGRATLVVELFDSVTGQLLLRATDTKSNEDDSFTWRIPRNQMTNRQDARMALNDWARMLVKGLDQSKANAR